MIETGKSTSSLHTEECDFYPANFEKNLLFGLLQLYELTAKYKAEKLIAK